MYGGGDYGGGGGYDTGGASQFAGGGFMPTQPKPAGPGGYGASNTAARPRAGQSQTLTPVTIKQLHTATQAGGEEIFLDGQLISNVTIVGRVIQQQKTSLHVTSTVDDGTGRADIKQWIDGSNDEGQQYFQCEPGTYIRVFGHLRTFSGKPEIVAFSMRSVEDHNEITFHFLECIAVHLDNAKGQAGNIGYSGMPQQAQPMQQAPVHNQYVPPPQPSNNSNGSMNTLQQRVQGIFNEPQAVASETGLHYNDVLQRLGNQFSVAQIKEAINFLQNEGHLYSTIDDDHWKSTSA